MITDKRVETTVEPINNYGRFAQTRTERRRRGPSPEGRYDGRTHATRLPAAGLARTPVNTTLVARLTEKAARLGLQANDLRADRSGTDEERHARHLKIQEVENAAAEVRRQIDRLSREDVTVGAVDDPWEAGQRTYATIDRRVDILEQELSHKRISEAAYRTGRQVQAVLERQGRIGGADWAGASRGDPKEAIENRIEAGLENANEILMMTAKIIRSSIGERDWRLLRRVIGERMSFADCAAFEGKSGERGTWYVAEKFRDALEQLAEVFASKGKGVPTPEDAYKEASADMDKRERVAIDRGVTRTRLAAELPDLRARAAATRSFRERCRLTAEAEALELRLARLEGPQS